MNLWHDLERLMAINPYLLGLFLISTLFWGLFLNQLLHVLQLKCGRTANTPLKTTANGTQNNTKHWVLLWFKQSHETRIYYQLHRSLLLMRALIVSMPMLGLAGTVMMLTQGFKTMGATQNADIHAFSDIVTGAMATTFTGVLLSVIGILLFKILDTAIQYKHKEFSL